MYSELYYGGTINLVWLHYSITLFVPKNWNVILYIFSPVVGNSTRCILLLMLTSKLTAIAQQLYVMLYTIIIARNIYVTFYFKM